MKIKEFEKRSRLLVNNMKFKETLGKMIVLGSLVINLSFLFILLFNDKLVISEPNKWVLMAEIVLILYGIIYFKVAE